MTGDSRPLRLLVVTAAPRWTGGERAMTNMAQGLYDRGHDVLLTYDPRGPVGDRLTGNVPRLPIEVRGDADPRALLALYRLIRARDVDVVCVNRFRELKIAGVAARLARRGRVVNRIGLPTALPNDVRRRTVYRTLMDLLVLDNAAGIQTIRRANPWLRCPILQARNGVDVPALAAVQPAARTDFGAAPDELLIASVARLGRKGSSELCAAAMRVKRGGDDLRPIRLVYIGQIDPEPARELRDLVREAGDGVRLSLLGHLSSSETLRVLAACDMLVRPSAEDGVSNSVLEAMALGLPVIAGAVGGLLEAVVDGETGLLVPPGDVEALSRAIACLSRNASLRRRMDGAARERVAAEFTQEQMLDQYEHAFRFAMTAGRRRSR